MYIGIDQSITNTGIVILDKKLKIEKNLSVSFSKYEKDCRLKEIYLYFYNLSKYYSTYTFGIEDYAFSKMFRREVLGELRGCIELALQMNNVKYHIIPIKHHRKVTYGNGNLSKEECKIMAERIYGVKLNNLDEYDAFSIAYACSCVEKYENLKNLYSS